MKGNKARWAGLVTVVGGGFLLLGFFGREIYRQAPPIPTAVVTESGRTLMIGNRKERRIGETICRGGKTKIALAAGTAFANGYDCFSGGERGLPVNALLR